MAKQNLQDKLKVFSDVCAHMGKNESHYDVEAGATNKEKARICEDRLMLVAAAFNGKNKVKTADTSQWKYMPWFEIVPDKKAPAGFRLSCSGYGYDNDCSVLGARPQYLERGDAIFAGNQFLSEYERWAQYISLAQQEI